MTTKILESESAEMTELSLTELDQAIGGGHGGHNASDVLFWGGLGAGLAVVGSIILVGLLA